MRYKKLIRLGLSVIICCVGLGVGISLCSHNGNKVEKSNVTEDSIINNLNNRDISNLVGPEKIEEDNEEKSDENKTDSEVEIVVSSEPNQASDADSKPESETKPVQESEKDIVEDPNEVKGIE